MTDFRHAGLDIRACIRSLAWQSLAGCLIDHNGKPVMDAGQVLDALVAELAAGREVLPIGRVCGEWDYKTGCKGHTVGDDGLVTDKPNLESKGYRDYLLGRGDYPGLTPDANVETKLKPAVTGIAKFKKGEGSK